MGKKRGNSEGSVYRRQSDGRWVAALTVGYANGHPRRKTRLAKTRQEADRLLTALKMERDKGLPLADERQTLGTFLNRWLVDTVRPSVRQSTTRSYVGHVRLHIEPALGHVSLARLSPQQVQAFLTSKIEEGLSPATVQRIRATLRKALNDALRWGLVGRNAATLVTIPKAERPKVHPFTPAEARAFLEAIKGDRLEALYAVALAVGLRQGEALGLRWDDIDLTKGTLAVRNSLQRIDGRLQLVQPKTDRSRRTIAVPEAAVRRLVEHRARQNRERLRAGDRWQDHGLVFTTGIGTPLDGRNVTRWFQQLLDENGLPRQRFHDLRHACASLLLAQGVNPRVVMETLGHSQIGLTLDTYSHVMPAVQREAAERMDALLSGR